MYFSFNGRSCTEFGLDYIPKESDLKTGIPEFKMIEKNPTYHRGGYHFGYSVPPRDFS